MIPQHIRINQETLKKKELSTKDLLVYANLKKYMNQDYIAYPAISTLVELTKLSKPTVIKCLNNLEVFGEITIIKNIEEKKRYIKDSRYFKNSVYKFNPQSKHYEMYSYEFLQDENTKPEQKGYLMKAQPIMIKEQGVGKMIYSDRQLADILNIPRTTIERYNNEFRKLGLLTTLPVGEDNEVIIKNFQLSKIGQAFVTILSNHEQRLQDNSARIAELENQIKELKEKEVRNIVI